MNSKVSSVNQVGEFHHCQTRLVTLRLYLGLQAFYCIVGQPYASLELSFLLSELHSFIHM